MGWTFIWCFLHDVDNIFRCFYMRWVTFCLYVSYKELRGVDSFFFEVSCTGWATCFWCFLHEVDKTCLWCFLHEVDIKHFGVFLTWCGKLFLRGRGDVSYVGWTTLCCVFLTWGVQHIPRRFLHCVYIFFFLHGLYNIFQGVSYMGCTTFFFLHGLYNIFHDVSYKGCTTFFWECFLHGVDIFFFFFLSVSYMGCTF